MLSGSYMTTMLNTLARLDVSRYAGSERAKAAGDDCLELFRAGFDYIQSYANMGFTIREATALEEGTYEFCSHEYRRVAPDKAPLTSWLKLCLRYFLLPVVTTEQYAAALHELRHNAELEVLRPLIESRYHESVLAAAGAAAGQNTQVSNIDNSNDAKQQDQNPAPSSEDEVQEHGATTTCLRSSLA
jgi:hypothetical protein